MTHRQRLKLKLKDSLRIGRAVRLVWGSGPKWTITNAVLLLVQGALPLASLYLMKLVVDAVVAGVSDADHKAAFTKVVFLVLVAAAVAFLSSLCRSLAGLIGEVQSQVVTDRVHDILHAKSVEVDLEYYENAQYYDAFHRAQQEAPFRPTRIVNGLLQIGRNSVSLVAILGLLISFHWGFSAVLLAAAMPGLLTRLKFSSKIYKWQRQRTALERRAWYFHWILTGDVYAKEVRLFGLGPDFISRYSRIRTRLREERLGLAIRRSVAEIAGQLGAILAVFGCFAFVAYRTIQGVFTLGDLVMYYQAFQRGQDYLQDLLASLANLYEDNLFLKNLYEFLDLRRRVIDPAAPTPVPRPTLTGIRFEDVSFRYPDSDRDVLSDVSLVIRPGEVVALVGENGSGKTTLIKLLCRLYDPTKGAITIDGVDLREFEIARLRREISVIFQDYAKYHLTARENIWFGDVNSPRDGDRIISTAIQSGADRVIRRLPKGYETVLGKAFEDGEELSIGQWQKVALARAFMRNAQVVVLDEPTSALDAKAEFDLFTNFRELVAGRSAIIISHRMSTVRMADCIYVLEGGRIVESGPHHALLGYGGMYASLFETQARNYR